MNKIFSICLLSAFFAFLTPSAFAWQYEGLNSLNPFTGFKVCNKCVKVKKEKCKKVNLCPIIQEQTKCSHCARMY